MKMEMLWKLGMSRYDAGLHSRKSERAWLKDAVAIGSGRSWSIYPMGSTII